METFKEYVKVLLSELSKGMLSGIEVLEQSGIDPYLEEQYAIEASVWLGLDMLSGNIVLFASTTYEQTSCECPVDAYVECLKSVRRLH